MLRKYLSTVSFKASCKLNTVKLTHHDKMQRPKSFGTGASFYEGAETPISEIRSFLENFEGGKIEVNFDNQSGIASLVLNNPKRRNAISGKMMTDLEKAVDKLEKWKDGKGVILHGAEGNFCSGGDLEFAIKTGNADDGFKMATYMQHVLTRLERLPLITVAFINGTGALGGGTEIAISCDFRLMTSDERTGFGFVHTRMGIVPAWGGCARLVKHVGYRKALDILSTAKIFRPDEALSIGLADGKAETVEDAARWLSERIRSDPTVVRSLKSISVNASIAHESEETRRNIESRLFAPLWGGDANKAALAKNLKHRTSSESREGEGSERKD